MVTLDNPKKMDYSVLKRSSLPEFAYIRVLNGDTESIVFLENERIVGHGTLTSTPLRRTMAILPWKN